MLLHLDSILILLSHVVKVVAMILFALLTSTLQGRLVLGSATLLWVPTHLILASRLLEHLKSVQVLHCDQVLLEVLVLKVIVGAEAENLLLLKLAHQDLLHLAMGKLSIVV